MNIPILFENDDYVVINKPAGLIVHPDGKTREEAVTDWVMEKYPFLEGVGEPLKLSSGEIVPRPGIVHRIDRETSGALIVAKSQPAFEKLKKQFQDREVRKSYHAFVWGEVKEQESKIDRPIGRSASDFRKWSAERGARGEIREAVTYYFVMSRGGGFTFLEAMPKTGRTHQIRVHFKAVGFPIVGDSLYAPKRPPALGFSRLALHARSVEFSGTNGEVIKAVAPYPDDFKNAIKLVDPGCRIE